MIHLHPRLTDPTVVHSLAETWQRRRSLRLSPLMADEDARAVHDALGEQPFSLMAPAPGSFRFQYWVLSYHPDEMADPVLSAFGRWLQRDVAALCGAITGRSLGPPEDRRLLSTLYTRGCYLDAHNDADGLRSVAYVVGLTPQGWPAESGGHLEFVSVDRGTVVVDERRPPGWNSLDLFDVSTNAPLHRVPPMLTDHRRRVFAGWFYGDGS